MELYALNQIRAIDENKSILHCFCLGYWEKVTEKYSCLFRDWALAIAPYDGLSSDDAVNLNFLPTWLQVHKLSEGYQAWMRLKYLMLKCPKHELSNEIIVNIFLRLSRHDKKMLDALIFSWFLRARKRMLNGILLKECIAMLRIGRSIKVKNQV